MKRKNDSKKKAMKLALSILMACSVHSLTEAAAGQEIEEYSLDPVVVTAQRQETKDLDTPATVKIITAEELRNTGALSVFDALEQTIGVTSYSYANGGADAGGSISRFYIRGFDKGTLVLVNGAPINLMNYNSTAGIPLEAVEKVEVIKGSNSVLYGAEAMGGVVNIITKKASQDSKTTTTIGGGNYKKAWSVTTSGESFSLYYDKDFLGKVDQTSPIFSKTNKYWRNLKSDKENFFLTAQLSDDVTFNWASTAANFNRNYMKAANGAATETLDTAYRYKDKRNNINLVYNDKEDEYKAVLAYNMRRLDSTKITSSNIISRSTNYNVSSWTFDNQKTWRLNGNKDSLIGGIVFKREDYQELEDRSKNIDRDAVGVYTSYTQQLTPKFSTVLGLRGEFVQGNGFDDDHNVFLPQLQTLYKLNDTTSWYTNIGKSFEMPSIHSKYYSSKVSTRKAIDPQEGWTYETGLKHIRTTDSIKLAVFHMDINNKFKWVKENTVFADGDPNTSIQINQGKFKNTGVEVEYVKLLNNNWKWNAGASYSNPEVNDDGKWVQESARVQFNAGVEYNKDKWITNLTWMYTGDREDSYYKSDGTIAGNNPDHKTPNRIQLNATVQYRPAKDDSVVLNMYNLLDRKNCINENENWDLPFNWMLSFKHLF